MFRSYYYLIILCTDVPDNIKKYVRLIFCLMNKIKSEKYKFMLKIDKIQSFTLVMYTAN